MTLGRNDRQGEETLLLPVCSVSINLMDFRSVFIGTLPLSCCVKIPDTHTVVLGSWDNTM